MQSAPRSRSGVALYRLPHLCTRCEGCSPHRAVELVYRIEWLRIRELVCDRTAWEQASAAMERGAVPDGELEQALADALEKQEAYIAQLEIEQEAMAREITEAHAALGEMDERVSALCTQH